MISLKGLGQLMNREVRNIWASLTVIQMHKIFLIMAENIYSSPE